MRRQIFFLFYFLTVTVSYSQNTLEKLGRTIFANAEKKFQSQDYAKSLKLINTLLSSFEDPDIPVSDTALLIDIYTLGFLNHYELDNTTQSISCLTKRLTFQELYSEASDEDIFISYYYLGLLYKESDSLLLSIDHLSKAISIYKDSFSSFDMKIKALEELGNIYFDFKKYEDALSFYQVFVEDSQNYLSQDDQRYISVYTNIGVAYHEQGDLANALFYYQKSFQLYQKYFENNYSGYASFYSLFGMIYTELGDFDLAYDQISKALELNMKTFGETDSSVGQCYYQLGNLSFSDKNYDKALKYFKQSFVITSKHFSKASIEFIKAQYGMGLGYFAANDYNSSLNIFNDALENCPVDNVFFLPLLHGIGTIHANMGNYDSSNYFLQKAILLAKNNKDPEISGTYYNIASNSLYLCDTNSAFRYAVDGFYSIEQKFTSLLSTYPTRLKESFFSQNKHYLDFFYNIFFRFSPSSIDSQFLLRLYNKSLLLKNMRLYSDIRLKKVILGSGIKEYDSLYKILNKNNQILYDRNFVRIGVTRNEKYYDSIVNQSNIIELLLMKEIEKEGAPDRLRISFESIKEALPNNAASINFFSFAFNDSDSTISNYTISFIVRKDLEYPVFIPLFEDAEILDILDKAENINTDIKYSRLYHHSNLGNELFELCWKPVNTLLYGIDEVYISPSGILNSVSFPILPNNCDSILSDKYEFHYLSTLTDIISLNQNLESLSDLNTGTIFSGIAYNSCAIELNNISIEGRPAGSECNSNLWNPLPAFSETNEMIDELRLHVPEIQHFTGTEATKELFHKMDGISPDLIHFYTHGFYCELTDEVRDNIRVDISFLLSEFSPFQHNSDPLVRTGLILAGGNIGWEFGTDEGILTAYEISQMDLSNTDLVILAACVTGLGDYVPYEGVYGLQRAFKMAGVDNIIMSLWPVIDTYTKEFFDIFYENLISKHSVHESFYHAQKTMRNIYPERPDIWGAFVLLE
ncbi:MAG: CHAT domain-containing tetratricopeptide repeat protein [Bacteroidales bacterium]